MSGTSAFQEEKNPLEFSRIGSRTPQGRGSRGGLSLCFLSALRSSFFHLLLRVLLSCSTSAFE